MKVFNSLPKGRTVHFTVAGFPQKIFLRGYESIEIDDAAEINYNGVDEAKKKIKEKNIDGRELEKGVQIVEPWFRKSGTPSVSFLPQSTGLFFDGYYYSSGQKGIARAVDINAPIWNQVYSCASIIVDITKSSNNIYFACGGQSFNVIQSIIIKSIDSGSTWTNISQTASTTQLNSISIASDNVWICGCGGEIIHSIDDGETWSAQTSGIVADLNKITFVDNNKGWCCGASGKILHTENGGQSWSAQTNGVPNVTYNDVFFLDENNGCAGGNSGTLLYTTNGGVSWIAATKSPANSTAIFINFSFTNTSKGWVSASYNLIYHTENGGVNWSAQTSPTISSDFLQGILFFDNMTGYAQGNNNLKTTNNGGETWTTLTSLTGGTKMDSPVTIKFVDMGFGNIVALGARWLGHSSNYGLTWDVITNTPLWSATTTGTGFMSQKISDSEIIFSTLENKIYKSNDSGYTWSQIAISNYRYSLCSYFINRTGWIAGNQGKSFKTTDGGETWTSMSTTANTSSNIDSIYFKDTSIGFIFVIGGLVLKTTNGGTTWTSGTTINGESSADRFKYLPVNDNFGYILNTSPIDRKINVFSFNTSDMSYTKIKTLNNVFGNSGGQDRIFSIGKNSYVIGTGGLYYTINSFKTLNTIYENYLSSFSNMISLENGWFRIFESGVSPLDIKIDERYI